MKHDVDHSARRSPYRERPPLGGASRRAEPPRGDAAILGGVAAVGAMPFVGVALGHVVESWELGVGVLGVLLAGWALVDDALAARGASGTKEVES